MVENPSVGVIGFGFSGLMVVANLLRETRQPLTIYIIDPTLNAKGAAYSTDQPSHLLNVAAERMGAWADAPEDFFNWLQSDAAKKYCAAQNLPDYRDGMAYVPRMVYGEYLSSIWVEVQKIAAHKNCSIKCVASDAVAMRNDGETLAILTQRGDAIAVQHAVLAIGNEAKILYPHLPPERVVQRPWSGGALAHAAQHAVSIAMIGTGLTTVDALLTLRALGYKGKIVALSRHGNLPQSHAALRRAIEFSRDDLLHHATAPSRMLRYLRQKTRAHSGDWRGVIDALRPHTPLLWRSLKTPDKQRFFKKLGSVWSVHRHRMAASIAQHIADEIAAQQFSIVAAHKLHVRMENHQVLLQWESKKTPHTLTVDTIINCTGVALDARRSKRPLLIQLLSAGLIEPHPTGVGIDVDAHHRVIGEAYAKLYAMGGLLTGAFLESIAVPELREQAHAIAKSILAAR